MLDTDQMSYVQMEIDDFSSFAARPMLGNTYPPYVLYS